MKIMMCLLVGVASFASRAWAIDLPRCPKQIQVNASVEKVIRSSKNKDLPGWKEALRSLSAVSEIETRYSLVTTRSDTCVYYDGAHNRASLATFELPDPQSSRPVLEDQLVMNLRIHNSDFVTVIPIREYEVGKIEASNSPHRVKIKTSLNIKGGRRDDFDMGMIAVTLQ